LPDVIKKSNEFLRAALRLHARLTTAMQRKLDRSFQGETGLGSQLLIRGAQRYRCKELTVITNRMAVVENNEAIVESRKSGLELSSNVPTDFEFAEFFGGGSDTFRF